MRNVLSPQKTMTLLASNKNTAPIELNTPLSQLLTAQEFSYIDQYIQEQNFLSGPSKNPCHFQVISFKESLTTENIIAQFQALRVRPATLQEFLTFCRHEAKKMLPTDSHLTTFGALWKSMQGNSPYVYTPVLYINAEGNLILVRGWYHLKCYWQALWYFLVVPL